MSWRNFNSQGKRRRLRQSQLFLREVSRWTEPRYLVRAATCKGFTHLISGGAGFLKELCDANITATDRETFSRKINNL
jgi:hypothetical protein